MYIKFLIIDYYIFDVTLRQSTLQPADEWVQRQSEVNFLQSPGIRYHKSDQIKVKRRVDFFGNHVAFDRAAWHENVR